MDAGVCVLGMSVGEIPGRTVVVHFLGSKGIIDPAKRLCVPYRFLLLQGCSRRARDGAINGRTRERLVREFEARSLVTGNAGGRMACASIRSRGSVIGAATAVES